MLKCNVRFAIFFLTTNCPVVNMQAQNYVQNLEILRRIALVLADVANCVLKDAPGTRKIEIFFETLRSEFRLLGHKLDEIWHSRNFNQLENGDQVLSLFASLDAVLSAKQLATPMQLVSANAVGTPTFVIVRCS